MITLRKLEPSSQKSYYEKAIVIDHGDGNIALISYNTIVCGFCDGNFIRFWGGYSRTTMKHVNDFRETLNLPPINKKEWEKLPVFNGTQERFQVYYHSILGYNKRKCGPVFDNYHDAVQFANSLPFNTWWYAEIEEV